MFDNCEHVITDAAVIIDDLRRSCPSLVVLATSREPLGLDGEVTWRVPSLSLPPTATTGGPLDGYDAVTLFLDRARRVRPDLRLDAVQMTAVVEVCRRLDGIPLAIELAAARCRQLAPERLARDLDQRFRLLTGGARTSLPRQQTLLASVEWSHDLLDDDARRLLRRLAVCAGTFRLGLAEALGATTGDLDRGPSSTSSHGSSTRASCRSRITPTGMGTPKPSIASSRRSGSSPSTGPATPAS